MPYDAVLADRIRELLLEEDEVTVQPMFGGLAFLVAGNMAVAADPRGGLMVRVAPQRGNELAAAGTAEQMEMHGRPMKGWLHLDADDVATERELSRWVGYALDFVHTLPAKQ